MSTSITEQEILDAIGRPVSITIDERAPSVWFSELTAAENHGLWAHHNEADAKAGLLSEIARRANRWDGCARVVFKVWPETKTRADGKASGYARAAFL